MGSAAQFGIMCNGHQLGIHGALGRIDKSLDALLQESGELNSVCRERSCSMNASFEPPGNYDGLFEKLRVIAFNVKIMDIGILHGICHVFFPPGTSIVSGNEDDGEGGTIDTITVTAKAHGKFGNYNSCKIYPCRYGERHEFIQSCMVFAAWVGVGFESSFDFVKHLCMIFLPDEFGRNTLITQLTPIYAETEAATKRALAEAEKKKQEEAKRFIASVGPAVEALGEYTPFATALAKLRNTQFRSMNRLDFIFQLRRVLEETIP
jgi:hypothetical protein